MDLYDDLTGFNLVGELGPLSSLSVMETDESRPEFSDIDDQLARRVNHNLLAGISWLIN